MTCSHGEYCFKDTPCDTRVMPGYGITPAPVQGPTAPPIPYDARDNYSFCGDSWIHANSCEMRFCGDGSPCPGEQR